MAETDTKFSITPNTKIAKLLDEYPQLEEILIEIAPAFKKLKNPILRKTIAKVTTLRQVAQIGELSLADLINRLRSEVGIQSDEQIDEEVEVVMTSKPDWFDENKIVKRLDGRPIIEAGEHPLNEVMHQTKELEPGQIFELITPFPPLPLIERIKNKGFEAWTFEEKSDLIKTYFVKLK